MTREAELEKLLSMLFPDAGELRRWLRGREATQAIVDELPGPTSSKAAVVHKAVELLVARGLVPTVLGSLADDPIFKLRRSNIKALADRYSTESTYDTPCDNEENGDARSSTSTSVSLELDFDPPTSAKELSRVFAENSSCQGLVIQLDGRRLHLTLPSTPASPTQLEEGLLNTLEALHQALVSLKLKLTWNEAFFSELTRCGPSDLVSYSEELEQMANTIQGVKFRLPAPSVVEPLRQAYEAWLLRALEVADEETREKLEAAYEGAPPIPFVGLRLQSIRKFLSDPLGRNPLHRSDPSDKSFWASVYRNQPYSMVSSSWFVAPLRKQVFLIRRLMSSGSTRDKFAATRSSSPPANAPSRGESETMSRQERATIGILTALPKELAAVRVMLDNTKKWTAPGKRSRTRYFIGEVPSDEGGVHVVAVAMLPDMGNNSAALSARTLLDHFPNVRHLIMCGIAGGLPKPGDTEHDVRLGDIVVSNRNGVVQYDMQKLTAGKKPELRHPPRPPGRELLDAVRHLETEALLGDQPWEAFLERSSKIKKARRPADNVNAKGEPVDYPEDDEREAGLPRVFSGTIAASNTLLKKPALRDRLGRDFGVKAIEMEGSGVADASWYDGAGYLVVRGICDYCDENKGDLWQGYAAVAAAAYVRALLESMAAEEPSSGRGSGGSSGGGGGGAGPNISGTFTNSPIVIGNNNSVSTGGQQVHNHGSVGKQVNVRGDATFNLSDFLKK